ncbi:hypothetical protein [Neobacillus sp. DY30]|uniref:hypothetical protein n=1 Tax=Neobacillus sp. DY30 TaxID=3047871 RepID=UPI0024BF1BC4|nr:hypothetical protein [Neobacillus sp. DY30]WHX98240.1 hypothetical protein QNH29_16395 [Neobacillus sp. DY30]
MKKNSHFTTFLFLCGFVALAAYLDSPFSIIHSSYSYSTTSEPAVVQPVDVEPPTDVPVLEYMLDDVKKMNGYFVETYQEYEVYYDEDGKVVKREPTSKTESIRYWEEDLKMEP